MSHPFTKFLNNCGVLHPITWSHTSQQNQIAKQKHGHIVETGLTLLTQSSLPSNYYVESFHFVVYPINRLTALVIHCCLPNKLDFFLDFRSKQCVLLSYGSNQKGYTSALTWQPIKVYDNIQIVHNFLLQMQHYNKNTVLIPIFLLVYKYFFIGIAKKYA